ncbi:MAG: hypothetical protein IH604_04560 [Burkholderiales bacterium]|nr:hypothetical protein [Burkholderiales bacterium]
MNIGSMMAAGAIAFALSAGMAQAKLPVAPMDDAAKAKAAEAGVKKAEAAKKDSAALAKAQDRAVERYKKEHGKGGAAPEVKAAKPAAKK